MQTGVMTKKKKIKNLAVELNYFAFIAQIAVRKAERLEGNKSF